MNVFHRCHHFVNELGKDIIVERWYADDGIHIRMAGPDSQAEWVMTAKEYQHLKIMLNSNI